MNISLEIDKQNRQKDVKWIDCRMSNSLAVYEPTLCLYLSTHTTTTISLTQVPPETSNERGVLQKIGSIFGKRALNGVVKNFKDVSHCVQRRRK